MKNIGKYNGAWINGRWTVEVYRNKNSIWIEIPFGELNNEVIDMVMKDLMEDRDVKDVHE